MTLPKCVATFHLRRFFGAATLVVSQVARADEVAPRMAELSTHDAVSMELAELVTALSPAEQKKLAGAYVAFNADEAAVDALPACDDDGDYVVVVSDGLLRLAEAVAYAAASDRTRGTQLVEAYGALLARAQTPAMLPLPPPVAKLPSGPATAPTLDGDARALFLDLIAWLVADEVGHVIAGDIVCPHPTAERERADDTWTSTEHDAALGSAPQHMQQAARVDTWATEAMLARGRSEMGAVAWLVVLAAVEQAKATGRLSSYLALHPGSTHRVEALRAAADEWRRTRARPCESCREEPRMR